MPRRCCSSWTVGRVPRRCCSSWTGCRGGAAAAGQWAGCRGEAVAAGQWAGCRRGALESWAGCRGGAAAAGQWAVCRRGALESWAGCGFTPMCFTKLCKASLSVFFSDLDSGNKQQVEISWSKTQGAAAQADRDRCERCFIFVIDSWETGLFVLSKNRRHDQVI